LEKGKKQIRVKKLSLPVKYLVGLVLVIIILLVSGYLYYNQLRNSLDTNYQSSIRLIAQTQNHKINEWYRNWLDKLNTIIKDSSITHFINLSDSNPEYSTLKGNIETQLRSYLAENDFGNIDIVNIDGKTIYSAGVKLGENSNRISSGLNIIDDIVQIDSYYFIVSDKNEIRLVVKAPIKTDDIKIGTAYVEINIDKVFGSHPNNILTKSNSDIDIYFVEGMNLTSLRKLFYKNLNLKDEEEFETILSYSDFVLIKNNEGFLSFKDSKTNEQFVYAINNANTGWIITTRDKNKEKYYYLIEQLSSYLVFGLAILIIISALVLILYYSCDLLSNDFEIKTDGVLLIRCVGNLIKNALEATDAGGRVRVFSQKDATYNYVSIFNDKVMPEEIQLQIFQRSFSTKTNSGRGIGTYSVKLLVEQYLKGKVNFVSNNETKTVFTISIPVI
jgi:hypothetical protein